MEILWKVNSKFNVSVCSIEGGNLTNAIPREANSIYLVDISNKEDLISYINDLVPHIKSLYKGSDSDLNINTIVLDSFEGDKKFSKDFQDKLLNLSYLIPTGPISQHPTNKELVHTSMNFAVIHTLEDIIEIKISTRSLTQYERDELFERLQILLKMSQLEYDIIIETVYPSWPPDFTSELVKKSKKIYKELFNEDVIIQAIHAGLECAFFSHYYPQMQMISFGPYIKEGHSPDERLLIKSVEKVWNFLIKLLKEIS
jgi:dipeptidase D